MFEKLVNNFSRLLFLIIFLIVSDTLCAQEVFKFEGKGSILDYRGDLAYGFKIVDADSIKEGRFSFQQIDPNALFKSSDQFFSASGYFESGVAARKWKFRAGNYQFGDTAYFDNNTYQLGLQGSELAISGRILQGRPDGDWIQIKRRIKKGQIGDTLLLSQFNFSNGIPQRSFKIESQGELLVGRFNSRGYAHDQWEVYSTSQIDPLEIWTFNDGRLMSISQNSDQSADSVYVFSNNNESDSTMDMGSDYFKIIQSNYFQGSGKLVSDSSTMGALLAENFQAYQQVDDFLNAISTANFNPVFKVKVPYFPLSDDQMDALSKFHKNYKSASQLLNSLQSNTSLKILSLYDEEVPNLINSVNLLKENHFTLFKKIKMFVDEGLTPFIDPSQLMPDSLFAKSAQLDSLVAKSKQLEFTLQFSEVHQEKEDPYHTIAELSGLSKELLLKINARISEKIDDQEERDQLDSLERELIMKLERFESLTDSLTKKTKGDLKNTIQAVLEAANDQLERYSKTNTNQEKIERAIRLNDCFSSYSTLSLILSKSPKRMKEIEELYIDEVWNPFTSTVMKEEVKKRITQAYTMLIVPYLMNEVENSMNCKQAQQIAALLEKSYKRVKVLREQDTQRIERKLKTETDPKKVMDILSIEL